MVPLKVAPSSTALSVCSDRISAISTPRIVTVWDVLRPTMLPKNLVPNKPAITAPASGASGTASKRLGLRSCPAMLNLNRYVFEFLTEIAENLAFEPVQVFHIDGVQITEHDHQDRKADCRFGSRHGQDEEDKDLPRRVAQVVREGDEVHVHCQQH